MENSQSKSDHVMKDSGLAEGPLSSEILAADSPWQSRSLVKVPRRLWGWARMAFLFFVIFAAFLIFIPWTQTISVHGSLSSYFPGQRPQEIHSQIKGKILKWHVNEGIQVTQGQVVLDLGDIDPKFMAPDLLNRLDESRNALESQRRAALEQAEILEQRIEEMSSLTEAALSKVEAKISEATNKIKNSEQRIPAAQGALEIAKLNLERLRKLEGKGLASRRELEIAIQKVTATEAELRAAQAALNESQDARRVQIYDLEKTRAELTQTLLDTQSKRATALGKAAKASKELAEVALKRSNAAQRSQARYVVAPFDGTVVRLSRLGAGEIVKEGDLLFTLAPVNASPAVEMWVSSIDAPLMRPGKKVRLLFQGVPAIPLPAWPEIMAGTFDGRIQVVDRSSAPKSLFRLWVVPETQRREWPPQEQIRPGTKVRGWVLLNRVPLWYEVWRRFNMFPPDYNSGEISLKDVLIPKAGRPKK